MMNTQVWYKFKDQEVNIDKTESIILKGEMTDSQKERLAKRLYHGNSFIPEQIGIKSLREDNSDQLWHQIDITNATKTVKNHSGLDCEDFVKLVESVAWTPSYISRNIHNQKRM